MDRNTYDFFDMENGVPTYAYDYETAVYKDKVLVPYYNYEVQIKFAEEGITYDYLSDEDKQRYEDDFTEDDYIPESISSKELNKFVFNEITVDRYSIAGSDGARDSHCRRRCAGKEYYICTE